MNQATDNPYLTWGLTAAQADVDERAGFIRKTYLHLLGAVVAFIGIEAALLSTPLAERMLETIAAKPMSWLVVLGAFIGVSWLANSWALSATSLPKQYLGLGRYVAAQAVIFLPLLYLAQVAGPPNVIANAAILTAFIFAGLTVFVFVTKGDFSFLRTGLFIVAWAAFATIVCSILFGFDLGIWFSGAMILLASGYIVYDTSNVLHHYRIGQHVAAALALFAAVALLFWWILRLLMELNRR
jgi:FtsH-binding integral membrane protein